MRPTVNGGVVAGLDADHHVRVDAAGGHLGENVLQDRWGELAAAPAAMGEARQSQLLVHGPSRSAVWLTRSQK
jgi:hypothetical protein